MLSGQFNVIHIYQRDGSLILGARILLLWIILQSGNTTVGYSSSVEEENEERRWKKPSLSTEHNELWTHNNIRSNILSGNQSHSLRQEEKKKLGATNGMACNKRKQLIQMGSKSACTSTLGLLWLCRSVFQFNFNHWGQRSRNDPILRT